MERALVPFGSGQIGIYSKKVVPLKNKLKRNGVISWLLAILIMLPCGIGGTIIGYNTVPGKQGIFLGLIGGSIAALILLLIMYTIRSIDIKHTKRSVEKRTANCQAAYQKAMGISNDAITFKIIASDCLTMQFFRPSCIYKKENGDIAIVSKDFMDERKMIRYNASSVFSYALLRDGSVLVNSVEGNVLLPPSTKRLFLDSNLPTIAVDTAYILDVSNTNLAVKKRVPDTVPAPHAEANISWDRAARSLSDFTLEEGE